MSGARRWVTVLACVCVVGLTAAGCANQATTAAQVGDTAIAESAIFDQTAAIATQVEQSGGAPLGTADLASINRSRTTSAIRTELLEIAAADEGVTVTDEQVNTALAGNGGADVATQLGAPASMVEQVVRDLLLLEGLAATQPTGGAPITNVTVRIDGVSVASRDEAVTTRTQFLADPASVDAIIAASGRPVKPQAFSVLDNPTVSATGVFAAQPGDVILYPTQDGYYVIRVLERTVEPAVLTPADLSAQEIAGRFDLGALLLEPYAQAAGVSVNPRLGVWDPLTLQVVPGGSGL